MDLRQLRYFAVVAEERSFTRAASRLHVTQSTVSHQIRQMEEELGKPLFERTSRRVVITEVGETLLASATRALREFDEGIRLIAAAADPLVGKLTISATHTFNIRLIPECVAQLGELHPAVSVVVREMFAAEVVKLVEAGDVDVGITYDPHRRDRLDFETLYVEEMVLAVGADHPFAKRRRVRMVELHRRRMILPTQSSATRRIIDDALRSVNAEPVVAAEIDSVAATVALVRRTHLGAIISRLAAPETKELRMVALESPTPLRTPGLLTRKNRTQSPELRSFIGILRRVALQQEGAGRRR
jgi:LysR family cyn operon transcriptional activator